MSVFEDFQTQLGSPDAVPKPRPGLNLAELAISAQEGMVLSRVDGTATVRELCLICGLGERETLSILTGLKERDLILLPEDRAVPDRRTNTARIRQRRERAQRDPDRASLEEMRAWATFPFDERALRARTDLSEVRRKRILYHYQRLDEQTYYEMLSVPEDADNQVIRRAYYRATKRFHPDRYFRRDIGPFRGYLATIFKKLGKAYDVLSAPEDRRKYDLLLMHRRGGGSEAAATQAHELYEAGVARYEAGDLTAALEAFSQAYSMAPQEKQYGDMVRRTTRAVQRQRGLDAARRAREAEQQGDLVAARDAFVEAAEAYAMPEHLERATLVICSVGGDLDRALQFGRLAVQLSPDSPGALRALAAVHERQGRLDEARGVLARAVALAPNDEALQARLRALMAGEGDQGD